MHWPELEILLESIDYHEAARKAPFLGSIFEDPLMFENVVCEMLFISFRPQCVKLRLLASFSGQFHRKYANMLPKIIF